MQTFFLFGGTGIGRCTLRIESAFIAHTDGVLVVPLCMGTHLMKWATLVHISVAGDVVVVAYRREATGLMPCDNDIQGGVAGATGSATVYYNQINAAVIWYWQLFRMARLIYRLVLQR